MIVHILTAKRYHLVPGIVKGFATVYKDDAQHRFLLIGDSYTDWSRYKELFHKIGFDDYQFVLSKRQLFCQLWRNRKHPVLVHADSYLHFLLAFASGCRNVSWVCWGAGASIQDNKKSKITAPLKSWMYHRFYSIVTLMEEDRKSIIRDFKIPPSKINTIPYASCGGLSLRNEICLRLLKENMTANSEKPIVLLGNNPNNMKYYIQLMDMLSPFKGKISVHCMMNYSLNKDQRYEDFINHGKNIFGDDFQSDEEFYRGSENYVNYMNRCDIYMCGCPDQTGLGALNTVLQLGKKVYVTGKNYEWGIKECDAVVFNINDVNDYDDFVKPLSESQKMHNSNAIRNKKQIPPKLWKEYLHQLNALG